MASTSFFKLKAVNKGHDSQTPLIIFILQGACCMAGLSISPHPEVLIQ
jgi:hypothetical protein